jgi:hypothetical protein
MLLAVRFEPRSRLDKRVQFVEFLTHCHKKKFETPTYDKVEGCMSREAQLKKAFIPFVVNLVLGKSRIYMHLVLKSILGILS